MVGDGPTVRFFIEVFPLLDAMKMAAMHATTTMTARTSQKLSIDPVSKLGVLYSVEEEATNQLSV